MNALGFVHGLTTTAVDALNRLDAAEAEIARLKAIVDEYGGPAGEHITALKTQLQMAQETIAKQAAELAAKA